MKRTVVATAIIAVLFVAGGASAAEWIRRQPGNHINEVEYEVHGAIGFEKSYGLGAGVRFGIPILKRGFISSINNNVAISFGVDLLNWPAADYGVTGVIIPVMLQWNFFLTPAWSVFWEVGFAPRIWFDRPGHGDERFLPWPGLGIGARYHFRLGNYPTLVLRLGFPTGLTVGVSF